jgi:hypothetical protein
MIFQRFSQNKKKRQNHATVAKPLSKTAWGLFDQF